MKCLSCTQGRGAGRGLGDCGQPEHHVDPSDNRESKRNSALIVKTTDDAAGELNVVQLAQVSWLALPETGMTRMSRWRVISETTAFHADVWTQR